MSAHGEPTRRDIEALHRHVAELLDGTGVVVGWIALEKAPYRDLFLSKQLGCWLLVTWADGTIGIEEDYPPYLLVGDLMSGMWPDEGRAAQYAVRWVPEDRREELWERYGIHESAGHYMSIMDRQRRSQALTTDRGSPPEEPSRSAHDRRAPVDFEALPRPRPADFGTWAPARAPVPQRARHRRTLSDARNVGEYGTDLAKKPRVLDAY